MIATALWGCLLALGAVPAVDAQPAGVLVVPFSTAANDGRTYWLGEAVSILIAQDIDARGLDAISRQARARAYDQLQLPPNAVLSRATVIKVGEIVEAKRVVVGEVSVDGDLLSITAEPIQLDIGRADPPIVERGDLRSLFDLARKVARRAVPGGDEPTLVPVPSLQAFEQYVKGLLAEEPASRAEFLEKAVALQPHYDQARLALWEVRTSQGDYQAALANVRAIQPDAPDARRANFLASVSLIQLKQYDQAFSVLQTLNGASPDPAILNNLGVVQIRRGSSDAGKPVYFLTKAAEASPDDPDILFNLGYAYALDRDPQGAIYWLREALRRTPTDGDAHDVLAAALDQAGETVEAARERKLAAQLSAHWADAERRTTGSEEGRPDASASVPKGLERLRQRLGPGGGEAIDRALANTAQRDQQQLAQFHLNRARRFFDEEQDTQALSELKQVVFLSPYEADAHLLIGRIDLRDGHPRDAVDALKISIWSADSGPARLALAEAYLRLKDTVSARAQAQRALELDPGSAAAKAMLERIDRGAIKSRGNRLPARV